MTDKSVTSFYFSFKGRMSRRDYLVQFLLPLFVIAVLLGIVEGVAGTDEILLNLFMLAALWPNFATMAKRLHDQDKSGWWQLLFIIPLVGFIAWIYFICVKGTEGPNRFGPPA